MSRLSEAEENSKAGNAISDQPIVVYDGILMKCSISKNAYVPEESINIEDLVVLLREGLLNPQSPVGCPQEKRKTSVFTSPMVKIFPLFQFICLAVHVINSYQSHKMSLPQIIGSCVELGTETEQKIETESQDVFIGTT